MIIRMNSIQLLIFIAICLTSCCKWIINVKGSPKQLQNLTSQDLKEAILYSINDFNKYFYSEAYLSYGHVEIGSPTHGQLIDSRPSIPNSFATVFVEISNKASRYLLDKYCWGTTAAQIPCIKQLTKLKVDETYIGDSCLTIYSNPNACIGKDLNYRTAEGSCNNLKHYYWGMSNTGYRRLLNPAYTDGIKKMNTKLPNPRDLSSSLVTVESIYCEEKSVDSVKTIAMAYWMMFIGHDLSHTVVSSQLTKDKLVSCCDEDEGMMLTPRETYWSCAAINIPNDDKFYSQLSRRCMNYVRSAPAMRTDCTFGPREQMNEATHYLDGSMIYGSTINQTWHLRCMSGGLMLGNTSRRNCNNINKTKGDLPWPEYMQLAESDACLYGAGTCFKTGDIRANAHPHLAVMYTLWFREHNRFARKLADINPHWNDERLFQEARKLVTASIQHITYNEWLPALLGKNYTRHTGLKLLSEGYSDAYDENADPNVSNSFATAALPLVNSMFDENLNLYSENREITGQISLMENYNRPTNVLIKYMDDLVRGLSMQNTQRVDMQFTQSLTNYLYSHYPGQLVNNFGMDIVSLDIQRSRDHGIPSYMEFRRYCGLKTILNEHDLTQIMVNGSTKRILEKYKTLNNIDLLIGALFEKHEDDAMVGPTMRCIITEQFIRTRTADRYFYDLPKVFNERQLSEIRNVSLARVFCNNLSNTNVATMQRNVFFKPIKYSVLKSDDLVLCDSSIIPKINLDHWKERV